MKKIAVIGAGIAGLTLAKLLGNNAAVTVFEKARGVGGRMATRHCGIFDFDHGAQFFRVYNQDFQNFIKPMLENSIIKEWTGRFVEFDKASIVNRRSWDKDCPHYVGVPAMNSIAKYLSIGLDVCLNKLVTELRWNKTWEIIDDQDNCFGSYDWVVVTAPAEQAFKLLPPRFLYRFQVQSIKMLGCFSLMLGFTEALPIDFEAALVRRADISWISVNSSKPGRASPFSLLVHSTNKWADSHIYEDERSVIQHLCNQTSYIIDHDVDIAIHKSLQRWRYANIGKQKGNNHLLDEEQKLAVCGDWLVHGRVEGAFLSALSLYKELITLL
jgi:renalase